MHAVHTDFVCLSIVHYVILSEGNKENNNNNYNLFYSKVKFGNIGFSIGKK